MVPSAPVTAVPLCGRSIICAADIVEKPPIRKFTRQGDPAGAANHPSECCPHINLYLALQGGSWASAAVAKMSVAKAPIVKPTMAVFTELDFMLCASFRVDEILRGRRHQNFMRLIRHALDSERLKLRTIVARHPKFFGTAYQSKLGWQMKV
jgi:hypothetical protein